MSPEDRQAQAFVAWAVTVTPLEALNAMDAMFPEFYGNETEAQIAETRAETLARWSSDGGRTWK